MIDALFVSTLLAHAVPEDSFDDRCEAVIDRIEVWRAVRAGDSEQIIEAADLIGECTGREELLTVAARIAWQEGNLEAVSVLAPSALRLIGDRGCAWVPLAAELAFAAGFAHQATGQQGASFYFHVADLVNDRTDRLPRNWRFVASHYAEDFGTYPPSDVFAFNSPYIQRPYRTDAVRCSDLPPFHINFDAPIEDVAYTVLDIRADRDGEIRRIRPILSYPGPLPVGMLDAFQERILTYGSHDDYLMVTFTPCASDWLFSDDLPPLCLPESDASSGEHEIDSN